MFFQILSQFRVPKNYSLHRMPGVPSPTPLWSEPIIGKFVTKTDFVSVENFILILVSYINILSIIFR